MPARPVAVRVAERGDVDAVGPAVDGVRARVAGLGGDLVGVDGLDQLRIAVLDVDDVDVRGAQARDQQVAALDVRVRRPRAQRGRAGVPAEVVQLVADGRHVEPRPHLSVRGRPLLEVDHRQRVRSPVAVAAGVERHHVRVRLGGRGGRLCRGRVEGRVGSQTRHARETTDYRAVTKKPPDALLKFSGMRGALHRGAGRHRMRGAPVWRRAAALAIAVVVAPARVPGL